MIEHFHFNDDRYHHFYLASKGNQFKNKRVLIEAIYKKKHEKDKQQQLVKQAELRRQKNADTRKRKTDKKFVADETTVGGSK